MAHNLDQKISRVLSRLGEQAEKERSGMVPVSENESMLAITEDTGVFFNIMLKATHARRILEVGTSVGYSTLWFADAIRYNISHDNDNNDSNNYNYRHDQYPIHRFEKPIIMTIDSNREKIIRAARNFDEAGVDDIVEIREGNAIDILKELTTQYKTDRNQNDGHYSTAPALRFDFVFLDADKENNINYFDLIFQMVKRGGIIAADNVHSPADCVAELSKYITYVTKRTDTTSVTVPIGNGEEITFKL